MVGSWRQYDAWAEGDGEQVYRDLEIIGTHGRDLLDSGRLPARRGGEIADVATVVIPARRNDEEVSYTG